MSFEPSERYACSFHGLWLWKTYCPICKLFEREPEKFCIHCKGFLKTVRMRLPWIPNRIVQATFCPKCEDEKRILEIEKKRAMAEDFPYTINIDGKTYPARATCQKRLGYVSKMLPAIKPELVMEVARCLQKYPSFKLRDVREEVYQTLLNHLEYDAACDKSQDLVAKMLANIDESLMTKAKYQYQYWDEANNKERTVTLVEYRLTERGREIARSGNLNILIAELQQICERKYPLLSQFVFDNGWSPVTETARKYAETMGLGLSEKTGRNRDVEAWIRFLQQYASDGIPATVKLSGQ